MKFTSVLFVVALAQAGSALDIGKLLGGLAPILKKAKCAQPCIVASMNTIKGGDLGLADAICKNVDKIEANAQPCLKKCALTKSDIGAVKKMITKVCPANKKRTIRKRQDEEAENDKACASCHNTCIADGCAAGATDDCAECVAVCNALCSVEDDGEEVEEVEEVEDDNDGEDDEDDEE
ncbi:hypothetical protein PT974_04521 [Cladobotryum mycophilum]|uniref:Uncharacterized protein n=1 Tax=Cladobotryum mycophilum TaxID=491253 RepID=A0ABR0SVQ5_9HYPO